MQKWSYLKGEQILWIRIVSNEWLSCRKHYTENCIVFLSLNIFILRKSIALNTKKLVTKKGDYEKQKPYKKALLTHLGNKAFSTGTQCHIVHILCGIKYI